MIYLHIGTLKTGSKSIQKFLGDHREHLLAFGYSFYSGCCPNPNNHSELHLATLRDDRDSLGRQKWPNKRGEQYKQQILSRVQQFLRSRKTPHAIFSNEGLSLLRYPDELDRLAEMIDGDDLRIILYLRNKKDFLRSYTNQICKVRGRHPLKDPNSALYVGFDSWLVDYKTLIKVYAACFGKQKIIVKNYDQELSKEGNILNSFQTVLQLPTKTKIDSSSYWLNRSQNLLS